MITRDPLNNRPKRVLLAVAPLLLREMLTSLLANEPDIELVGVVNDPVELLYAVGERNAQVVIASWQNDECPLELCTHLFAEYPGLHLIGIADEVDSLFSCRQVISAARYTSPTVDHVLAAIRQEPVIEVTSN